MGDYADDIIDQICGWGDPEGPDDDDIGGYPGGRRRYRSYRSKERVCTYCKQGGLHWKEHKGPWRWRLYSGNQLHDCRSRKWQRKQAKALAAAAATHQPREHRRFMVQEYVDSFVA